MAGMGMRGVTRPYMGDDGEHGSSGEGGEGHGMGRAERVDMLRQHHRRTLWVYWTLIVLGGWTLAAPLTLGYGVGAVEPSGGREVWLSLPARVAAMTWSDIASGLLLIGLGWRALTPGRPISLWLCCGVGIWLNLAPLLFWAPTAAAYFNGVLVGTLVIALTVLIPGMPNMILFMRMGEDRPPGWSYNPASWVQRSILIALAFAGWIVSLHLTAYQLGFRQSVWEPFFGPGSVRVLDSEISHSLPISDAGLGSFAFTIEFLMGWMGSQARWRTMPWMVTFFGILVIPLGLVHVFLVISQPVTVGAWCTFCLLAAALMLPMIPLAVDEVVAMGQHIVSSREQGEPFWRVFWKGGPAEESAADERTPDIAELPRRPAQVIGASLQGVSWPWTLVAVIVLGLWSMFSPAVLGLSDGTSHAFHLLGALAVVVAVVALGEPLRALRYLIVPIGLALALLPWWLSGGTSGGSVNGSLTGLALVLLALPRGAIRETYGGWDRWVV